MLLMVFDFLRIPSKDRNTYSNSRNCGEALHQARVFIPKDPAVS